MSTQEASSNERAVKVPPNGWCWLRKDSHDEHTRQYWRDGKPFCLLVARPALGPEWQLVQFWEPQMATDKSFPSEELALQAMDQAAIGIHATLSAQGIEIVCLNLAKGD
jgi:hypothetical protein